MAKNPGAETPLMRQYNAMKAEHPGALLLFRVGDFYETFGEDAITTSRILGITLTRRNNGGGDMELAGFPHHSLDTYLPRLVRALRTAGREAELADIVAALAGDGRDVADALAYAAILADELEPVALLALARDYVGREPAVAELTTALAAPGALADDATLRRLCGALRRQALRSPRFRCAECGFSSSGFFWQCPGCKRWDSLKPLSPSDLAGGPWGARRR
jgi:hypothetical protein